MDDWNDLLVATAGTASVLAGLIFVGLSINLDKLGNMSAVLLRAASALALLITTLSIAILLLIPEQSLRVAGIEVIGVTLGSGWVVILFSRRSIFHSSGEFRGNSIALSGLRVGALAPLLVGGALMIAQNDIGLDLLVPGFLLSFVVAIVEAWVVLVEIAR